MSLWRIAWRSIQQRALASTLTGLSMALGVALVVAVLVALSVITDSFTRGAGGYHLVVGKKGSQLQLVLNTVYHLQDPIENIPYSYYKEFIVKDGKAGKFAPYVRVAVPYCLGDNYEGFRVVGTTPALFNRLEYAGGKKYEFESPGRNFKQENFFEAVIGATVAKKTGLKLGDEFQPVHGLSDEGDGHKHDAFKIVGILKPTGTANDRALFINMEGFYLLDKHAKPVEPGAAHGADADHDHAHEHDADGHEHAHMEHDGHDHAAHEHAEHDHAAEKAATTGEPATKKPAASDEHAEPKPGEAPGHEDHDHAGHDHDAHDHADHDHDAHDHAGHDHAGHDHSGHDHSGHDHHHEPLPDDQREVTAILVLAADDLLSSSMQNTINEGETAQAVSPIRVISDFFKTMVNAVSIALLSLTVLIIVVSGIGIMVSIYNSMNERRRDIAVMRALGAGRSTVLSVILLESILLSLGGGIAGFLLGHALVAGLGPVVERFSGVSLGFFQFSPYELALVPGLMVLATLSGYVPALNAYRTDVARALSASP